MIVIIIFSYALIVGYIVKELIKVKALLPSMRFNKLALLGTKHDSRSIKVVLHATDDGIQNSSIAFCEAQNTNHYKSLKELANLQSLCIILLQSSPVGETLHFNCHLWLVPRIITCLSKHQLFTYCGYNLFSYSNSSNINELINLTWQFDDQGHSQYKAERDTCLSNFFHHFCHFVVFVVEDKSKVLHRGGSTLVSIVLWKLVRFFRITQKPQKGKFRDKKTQNIM